MRGHSGKSAAPRERKALRPKGLTCSGPRRQAVSRLVGLLSSPPARWRAYMIAASGRQARFSLISLAIPGLPRTTRSWLGVVRSRKNLLTTSCGLPCCSHKFTSRAICAMSAAMLRQHPRMTSATKGTSFGAGKIARVLI